MLIKPFDTTDGTCWLGILQVLATGNVNSSFNSHVFSILPKVTRPDGIYVTVAHLP